MQTRSLTQKELVKLTACRPYLIRYYYECGYLPVDKESTGPGDPVIYKPAAIGIIKKRMAEKNHISGPLVDEHHDSK